LILMLFQGTSTFSRNAALKALQHEPLERVPALCSVVFNEQTMQFATAAGREVRLWSALTGRVQRSFADLGADDISAMCADDKRTRLFVGDRRGNVAIYNFATGALLRRLCGHRSGCAVQFIGYSQSERVIVSAGADGVLLVHDDNGHEDETVAKARVQLPLKVTPSSAVPPMQPKTPTANSPRHREHAKREARRLGPTQQRQMDELIRHISLHASTLDRNAVGSAAQTRGKTLTDLARRYQLPASAVRQALVQSRKCSDEEAAAMWPSDDDDDDDADSDAEGELSEPLYYEDTEMLTGRQSNQSRTGSRATSAINAPTPKASATPVSAFKPALAANPMQPAGTDVSVVASVSSHLALFATALSEQDGGDAQVYLYDTDTAKRDGHCIVPQLDRSTAVGGASSIIFLHPYPYMLVASGNDKDGRICAFFVRPSRRRDQLAFVLRNRDAGRNPCAVSSMSFDAKAQTLYTGDSQGVIKSWSLSSILSELGEIPIILAQSVQPLPVAATPKNGMNQEVDAPKPVRRAQLLIDWANQRYGIRGARLTASQAAALQSCAPLAQPLGVSELSRGGMGAARPSAVMMGHVATVRSLEYFAAAALTSASELGGGVLVSVGADHRVLVWSPEGLFCLCFNTLCVLKLNSSFLF
jgi:WD40 repeat protein